MKINTLGKDCFSSGNDCCGYKDDSIIVEKVQCSNKIVNIPLFDQSETDFYIDLDNGNVVSGYRPGGEAFLLGNLVKFYESLNYSLELSNMRYWLEAVSMGEVGLEEAGAGMAENPSTISNIAAVLLKSSNDIGEMFVEYLGETYKIRKDLERVLAGRKGFYSERSMICGSSRVVMDKAVAKLMKILSYLRARNKDFETLYCRDDDSFYIKVANKYAITAFKNKDEIIREIRALQYLPNSVLTWALRGRDSTPSAELHDFMLDLEKINQVCKKL